MPPVEHSQARVLSGDGIVIYAVTQNNDLILVSP